MKKIVMSCCCLLLLAAAGNVWAGAVQGRLIDRFYMPLAGGRILFYPDGGAAVEQAVVRRLSPGGWFRVELPAGRWRLAVRNARGELLAVSGEARTVVYQVGQVGTVDLGSVVVGGS